MLFSSFYNQTLGPRRQITRDKFEGLDFDLCFRTAVPRVKVWRCMVPKVHVDVDPVERTDSGHLKLGIVRLGSLVVQDMSFKPFSQLTRSQRAVLDRYRDQLLRFNQRLNLISRETESEFRTQHLLHCLTLTYRDFPDGCTVVDWGTGGGLPAIPLAICYPQVTVVGLDSVGKKVRAVRTMARRLGLENCYAWKGRADEWGGEAHYSVSRGSAPVAELWRWHRRVAVPVGSPLQSDEWPSGLLCLKGGDLSGELSALWEAEPDATVERYSLESLLGRNGFFAEKELIAVQE